MNRNKSFVSYTLKKDKAFLGTNLIVGTMEGNMRRICENCSNRCLALADPKMSDCMKKEAKKSFGAGEGMIMPKKLDGQPVGNFCKFFESAETSDTGQPEFSANVNTTDDKPSYVFAVHHEDEATPLFVAPARGKYYYPIDAALPPNTNQNNLRKFFSLQEAINAGFVSKF